MLSQEPPGKCHGSNTEEGDDLTVLKGKTALHPKAGIRIHLKGEAGAEWLSHLEGTTKNKILGLYSY